MISLTIGTNTERKTVLVEADQPLNEVLEDNNVSTVGAALHLNGSLIAGCDAELSLQELGVEDGGKAMLIAVVKADSAR